MAMAQRRSEAVELGQRELFGDRGGREELILPPVEPWPAAERLQREYEAIGFFLRDTRSKITPRLCNACGSQLGRNLFGP